MSSSKELVRKRTFDDLVSKLQKEPHKCVLPRPTGFGKTWMLTDLIHLYKNVLYLYPADVIKQTVVSRYYHEYEDDTLETYQRMESIPGVTLMTYSKLAKLTKEDEQLRGYDLVIFDECHRLGAEKTKPQVQLLFDLNSKAHFVGATATPTRTDGFDIVAKLFDNITVFEYTLHDAFQDGLLQRPYYCFCPFGDIETDLKEAALTAGEDIDNLRVQYVLKRGLIEIANISAMDKVLDKVCNKFMNTSYMKFICFFSNHQKLTKKSNDVKEWFKQAFPNHNINCMEISSRKRELAKNVEKLETIHRQPNRIDLIFCVDMLNMGYHVDDITGILMYRTTNSDIIYTQQLGRALSSGSSNRCIVFDVVDNIHRKGVFDLNIPNYALKQDELTLNCVVTSIEKDTNDTAENETIHLNTLDEDSMPAATEDHKKEVWYKNVSKIYPEDLVAVDCMATYKELIAKVVAEPMHIRCREAFEAHFRRWCRNNNIPYPISDEKLESLYGLKKEDFLNYFKDVVDSNKLDYPMRDAKKLLEIGRTRPDGLPLEIFAKWKNVSIESILELLGVA